MQLTTFLITTFTILGLAATSPTENRFANSNLAFMKRQACDCPAVIACCDQCRADMPSTIEGEQCCNGKCMEEFPECVAAC